jgi:hypothetical protein
MAIRTAEDFYRAVRVMREAQKYYDKTRLPMARGTARLHEDEIDRFIRERDKRLAEQKQGTLIGGGK